MSTSPLYPDLRALAVCDVEACLDLWARTPGVGLSSADDAESVSRFIERNAGLCWCFATNDRIVGTILCGSDGRRGYLYHVAVDEEFRREGLGRRLVEAATRSLRSTGIEKCHAMVFASNDVGRSFWVRSGWQLRDDLVVFSRNIE